MKDVLRCKASELLDVHIHAIFIASDRDNFWLFS
jgi:hypothetical protein